MSYFFKKKQDKFIPREDKGLRIADCDYCVPQSYKHD